MTMQKPRVVAKPKTMTRARAPAKKKSQPKREVKVESVKMTQCARLSEELPAVSFARWIEQHGVAAKQEWLIKNKLDDESLRAMAIPVPMASTTLAALVPVGIKSSDINDCLKSTVDYVIKNQTLVTLPHILHAAVRAYTHDSELYRQLNQSLRQGIDMSIWNPYNLWLAKAHAHLLATKKVAGVAGVPTPTTIYRGVPRPFSKLDYAYVVGDTSVWPAWSSCSSNRRVAVEFAGGRGGTLFEVQTINAIPLRPWSAIKAEEEHLLRPPFVFKVTAIVPPTNLHDPTVIQIIECDEWPQVLAVGENKEDKDRDDQGDDDDEETKDGKQSEGKEEKKQNLAPTIKAEAVSAPITSSFSSAWQTLPVSSSSSSASSSSSPSPVAGGQERSLGGGNMPLSDSIAPVHEAPSKKRKQSPTKCYLILVNDKTYDSQLLIESLCNNMPDHGLHIISTRDSAEAVATITQHGDEVVGLITNMTRLVGGQATI